MLFDNLYKNYYMKKLLLMLTPLLFFSCDDAGDCGCEIYNIIVAEDGKESYSYVGLRSGYCSQYDDLEGYYYYDINCE